jgi:hypothetical protein
VLDEAFENTESLRRDSRNLHPNSLHM